MREYHCHNFRLYSLYMYIEYNTDGAVEIVSRDTVRFPHPIYIQNSGIKSNRDIYYICRRVFGWISSYHLPLNIVQSSVRIENANISEPRKLNVAAPVIAIQLLNSTGN
jgi:hypothetical protein